MSKSGQKILRVLAALILVNSFHLPAQAADDLEDDEPSVCRTLSNLQKKLAAAEKRVRDSSLPNGAPNDMGPQVLDSAKTDRDNITAERDEARDKCDRERSKISKAKNECRAKNVAIREQSGGQVQKDMYKWEDGECVSQAKSPTVAEGDGDCGNASQFEGGLRGENCKRAASTIKDVEARNKTVTETTTMATAAFAQVTAMTATGQQSNAQESQQKLMQGLALAKMASAGSQLAGAAQLKSAASGAEEASTKMNGAYKGIQTECTNNAAFVDNEEGCFYAMAPKYNVAASKVEFANYDRLKSGASQSQDQADRANSAFKTSTITGLADAMVGLQAMQAAKMANQNTTALNTLPPPTFILNGTRGSSMQPGVGGVGTENKPIDYGTGTDSGGLLGNVGNGGVPDGLIAGQSFGKPGYTPTKSTVSSGGAGAPGGGRGGGGGGGAGDKGKKGKQSLGNTGVGEYNLAGGMLQNPKVDNSKKDEGGNPFADALAKLFPPDKDGKTVVDGRQIASDDSVVTGVEGQSESGAYASDLSIFEQVSARIRQLSNSGRI